jgi:hypothetical protein
MAAFFSFYGAAVGYPGEAVRTARQATIEIAARFARLWDGILEIVVFLWALVVSAFFGLIAVGFWRA